MKYIKGRRTYSQLNNRVWLGTIGILYFVLSTNPTKISVPGTGRDHKKFPISAP